MTGRPTPRFGTDGVRGVAYEELTPAFVAALGRATARVLGVEDPFLVARDTRQSGPMIEEALAAGLGAEGAAVYCVGVLPTPGLAFLSQSRRLPGAMISASHNPYRDNGIKLFGPGGRKIADDVERRIEAELDRSMDAGAPPAGASRRLDGGAVSSARRQYLEHLAAALEGRDLRGVRVVLDCANGAASAVAPELFSRLGAEVTVLHAEPDGTNINEGCGSTHPRSLQHAVLEVGAEAGLAFDGDADRLIAVDERGSVVDGDQVIAVAALDLLERGRLRGATVVVTVMSNLGFRRAMEAAGIRVVETAVGDRAVLEAMERGGYVLGGEQSGHVVFADLATTGDGLLTGAVLLDIARRSGRPLSALASVVRRLPQVLRSVAVTDRASLAGADGFWEEVRAVETELGDRGRVLVRPSGTEPVVRIMVEADTEPMAEASAARLADRLTAVLGSAPA